jgi:uncharacterized caspase-like protein
MVRLLSCALLLGLLFTLPVYAKSERLALVIGNADYKVNALANAANDAEDIAHKLESLNFDVMHYSNLDKHDLKRVVREFATKANLYDVILFYFAGHGVQVNGENYLIPVDIEFNILQAELEEEAVKARIILSMMSEAPNKTNLFILDACRDNPFRSFNRSVSRGLASLDGAAGTLIAYATAPGSTAADGDGRNGIYTEHLLKNLDKPGLTVEQMLKKVRIDVLEASGNQQTPWENSSLRGDFCFTGCESTDALQSKKLSEQNRQLQEQLERAKQQDQASEKLNAENARLMAQIDEIRRNYEAEKQANQQRLQKLADIQQQKSALEERINTEQHSLAAQKELQQQLQTLQSEKQQLEAKVASSEQSKTSTQQMEALQAKKLIELQQQLDKSKQQSQSSEKLNAENTRLMTQIDEIRRNYEAEKQANQQRLQKLADIQRQKDELEQRLEGKRDSAQEQEDLRAQLSALRREKQQLEDKVQSADRDNANNQQLMAELKRSQEATSQVEAGDVPQQPVYRAQPSRNLPMMISP